MNRLLLGRAFQTVFSIFSHFHNLNYLNLDVPPFTLTPILRAVPATIFIAESTVKHLNQASCPQQSHEFVPEMHLLSHD